MQKRILCLSMVVALCISLFPSPTWAAQESDEVSAMTTNGSLVSPGVFDELESGEATADDSHDFSRLNCHEMTELWFGRMEASLLDANLSNTPEEIVSAYFAVRENAFPGAMRLLSAQDIAISSEVQTENIQHTQAIQDMQKRLNIIITDADVTTRILEDYTIYADSGLIVVYVYEWTFYDYDNLADGIGGSDVSGYGTYHKITLNAEGDSFRIMSDEYDETDIFGISTISDSTRANPDEIDRILSYDMENGNVSGEAVLNEETASLLSPNYYESYNPYQAVEYADTYWSNYNPAYYNFGPLGGDCANFTSQCINAGGMPQVQGSSYGVDGWFYITSSNRSATWTGAGQLRVWMANNRGLQVTANNSNVWLGSPVFYNSNAHAVICVGRDSSGTAIIDSHTRDRYHALWNYYGASTTQTVQLTPAEPGQTHDTHIKGAYQWYEASHPHYHYWRCSICGELFTDGSTEAYVDNCEICNPPAPVAPGAPSVTVSGHSVTVSWNAVANATHYDAYLVQEPWRWEDIKYSSGSVTQTSFTFDNVAVGTYNAFVISRPNADTVQSGWTSLSVNASAYYLDVNAYLDDASAGGLGDYGTLDVYINGSLVADDVSDYYAEWPSGTSYEIKDIKPKPGYSYDGLREGTRVGAIGSGTVNLAFAFSSVDASGVSAPRAGGTFNNHVYLFCDREVTWYAAKQLCEFMGGHLVTIASEEENQFVHLLRGESRVWLGATHASGAWEWITGEAFSYDKWAAGEWNNATENDEGSENYAEQAYWDAAWNDLSGYVPRGFVCEIDAPVSVDNGIYMISSAVDGRTLDISGASMEQGANIQTWENLGIDSQRFTIAKEGDYYTIVALHSGMAMDVEGAVVASGVNISQCPLNGNNAQKWMFEDAGDGYVYIHSALGFYADVCGGEAKDGANIWTYWFNGSSAQKFRLTPIYYLDVNGYLDGAASGGLGDYGTADVWINGSLEADDVSDYYARWPAGTSYEIKDIKPKAGYSYNGVHEGVRSGTLSSTHAVTLDFTTISDIEENPERMSFNGHTYLAFNTPVTWYAAERICENHGGHLATITSAEENAFVRSIIAGEFWIGGTDADDEQHWRWVTQEAFSYENWRSGQPDNSVSYEVSLTHTGEENHLRVYEDGAWNDISGCLQYPFVCEIDSAPSNAPQIAISDRMAAPGSSIRVPVLLKDNPGLVSFRFKVAYDASKLELTGVDNADYNLVAVQNLNSPVVFNFTDATGGDRTDTGAGALNFQVKDGASGEAAFSVVIDDPDDFYNAAGQPVTFSTVAGKVAIQDYTPGDVNDDGKVNNRDVGRLQQFLSDWDVTIVRAASDTNADGKINNRDVGRLQQFLSDWDVTLCGGTDTETQSGRARLQAAGPVTIAIDGRTAAQGETIQVPVLLKDNPGLVSFRFKVSYDSSKLELTGRDDADYALVALKDLNSPVIFNFTDATGGDKRAVNAGVLNFKVKDGASGDAEFSIVVEDPDDFYNTSEDAIGVEISAGVIHITSDSGVSTSIEDVQRNLDNAVTANVACSDRTATVFCAVYNSAGKMIAVESAQVTESTSYDFRFGNAQFDYAKVFILDSNFMPLCVSAKTL